MCRTGKFREEKAASAITEKTYDAAIKIAMLDRKAEYVSSKIKSGVRKEISNSMRAL